MLGIKAGLASLTAVVSMAATLVAAPVATAAPRSAASPDPDLTVTSIVLGRSSVAVSGLNTYAVPVTVKGGYASTDPGEQNTPLNVFLKRTGGTGGIKFMKAGLLKRTAGTLQNGTWTGHLYVPSTANGTFHAYGVKTGTDLDGSTGSMTTETLFNGPNLAVTGLHQPKIGISVIPKVVPFGSAYQLKTAITDSATGKPYGSKILVQVVNDNLCVEYDAGSKYTDAAGVLVTKFPAAAADSLNCVRLRGRFFDTLSLGFFPARPGIVGAAPAKTSVPVNTVVPVNGSVAGAPGGCQVTLQRFHSSGVWLNASSTVVRQSGRFTLSAQPPYRGNNTYRVLFPRCNNFQAGVSKSFVIRGS